MVSLRFPWFRYVLHGLGRSLLVSVGISIYFASATSAVQELESSNVEMAASVECHLRCDDCQVIGVGPVSESKQEHLRRHDGGRDDYQRKFHKQQLLSLSEGSHTHGAN